MKNYINYSPQYFVPPYKCNDWVNKERIEKAPKFASVDLRDGNQALITPMNLQEKLDFFKLLVQIGFKEIEVGFPASSETEYAFVRELIEKDLIPNDVTIQVLSQAREHILTKTFEAVNGAKNVVIHIYNSTSKAQREQVFRKSKEEIKQIALNGCESVLKYANTFKGRLSVEYSPESFSGTELDFALEVCNAVIEKLHNKLSGDIIINLPSTVENAMPHIFASQVEYMSKNLIYRDEIILSVHPHNDRGTAVATAELSVLAGADRIEGTLFGNGERTGNLDIVTFAMNLYTLGVEPTLDFSNMNEIVRQYESYTKMQVNKRSPYAGELVFTAFSGSHQDAISKSLAYRKENNITKWEVPYLPINPADLGRELETDVIRINSQSGKGGVGYILKLNYQIDLPQKMKEHFSYKIKDISDKANKELSKEEIVTNLIKMFASNKIKSELNLNSENESTNLTKTTAKNTENQYTLNQVANQNNASCKDISINKADCIDISVNNTSCKDININNANTTPNNNEMLNIETLINAETIDFNKIANAINKCKSQNNQIIETNNQTTAVVFAQTIIKNETMFSIGFGNNEKDATQDAIISLKEKIKKHF